MCYYVYCVLGKYRTNELLRVSCFEEVSHKWAITCFVFWGSIAQMSYYVFRVLGKYCTKCARESIVQMRYYVFRVLEKYRTNELLRVSCFEGSIAHMQNIFRVPRRYHKNVGYVYWYSTAQMRHISSAPAKLKYSRCLMFLVNIANI
jgi:hypothetical protein